MQSVTIGMVKNPNQVIIMDLARDNEDRNTKTIDLIDMNDAPLQCLFIADKQIVEQVSGELEKFQKQFPIVLTEEFGISANEFETEDKNKLLSQTDLIRERWILQNNLITMEEIFPLRDHLKNLYVQDRNTFFEELWYLFKNNFGTKSLNIIFHDVKELTPEEEKKNVQPKLFFSYIEGDKTPNFKEGGAKEDEVYKHFKESFIDPFEIIDYEEGKGQLTALAQINGSPIIIMAVISRMNSLQQTLFKALFSGLQEN